MTPREVLLKAAEYVERGHTKGASARNASGEVCDSTAPYAACWCSLGGLYAAAATDVRLYNAATTVLATVIAPGAREGEYGPHMVIRWNDAPGRTQAEVVQALRAAAETCT